MKQRGRIDVHGLSIRGTERERSRDHFAIAELAKSMKLHQTTLSIDDESRVHGQTQGQVFLVAEGVADLAMPARVSREAVDRIVHYFLDEMPWYHLADGKPEDVTLALTDALTNAQQDLRLGLSESRPDVAAMLTVAFVSWPDLYLAHLGRNRCYVHRGGALRLMTTDHDVSGTVAPQVQRFRLELGDVLALCSDGLTDEHTPGEIASILDSSKDAEWMCGELVSAHGPDDRTAVVVRFLPYEPVSAQLAGETPPSRLGARREEPRHRPTPVRTPGDESLARSSKPFFLAG
jgi:serine/threonine protein phosphatase PrpC